MRDNVYHYGAVGDLENRQAEKPRLLDSAVRDLLDYIAVELAAEYVRLMEAAANAEAPSSLTFQADN